MGLKGAPNYFQKEISTTVLGHILGFACDLYIDDVIIYGKNDDDYIESMEKVLKAMDEKNITCNPDKCKFGYDSVKYVGRVIDSTGISVPTDKVEEILNFPLPKLLKDLQSFVGLVNYLSYHLRDASTELGALRRIHENAIKSKQLKWTEEGVSQFNHIKDKVKQFPKLFFINKKDPVILYTDASDFGIGAYLAQVVDRVEQPVAFLSKSLSGPIKVGLQLRKNVMRYITHYVNSNI